MTVEVNIDYLIKNKITANEFLVLQMIIEKQDNRLNKFQKVVGDEVYANILSSLKDMGFIDTIVITSNDKEIVYEHKVTETALRTFKGKGYFEEFYAAFPVSVIRPDGKRESLRTDKKRCNTKYNRIAKRKDVHEHIIKCLEFEISERKRTNSLMYMKKMPNWLSSETWKEYEEKMKVSELIDIPLEEEAYGTKLV